MFVSENNLGLWQKVLIRETLFATSLCHSQTVESEKENVETQTLMIPSLFSTSVWSIRPDHHSKTWDSRMPGIYSWMKVKHVARQMWRTVSLNLDMGCGEKKRMIKWSENYWKHISLIVKKCYQDRCKENGKYFPFDGPTLVLIGNEHQPVTLLSASCGLRRKNGTCCWLGGNEHSTAPGREAELRTRFLKSQGKIKINPIIPKLSGLSDKFLLFFCHAWWLDGPVWPSKFCTLPGNIYTATHCIRKASAEPHPKIKETHKIPGRPRLGGQLRPLTQVLMNLAQTVFTEESW